MYSKYDGTNIQDQVIFNVRDAVYEFFCAKKFNKFFSSQFWGSMREGVFFELIIVPSMLI